MRGIVLRTVQSLPPIRIEPLEPRMLLTGVTLIAHGFGGSAAGWETTMGQEIAEQSGPLATQPMYLMTLTDPGHDGGPLSIATTRLGPTYANWGSHEIIVLLDWSDVAGSLPFGGYHRTTQDCGTAVANQFLMPYSIPDLATPLAELPDRPDWPQPRRIAHQRDGTRARRARRVGRSGDVSRSPSRRRHTRPLQHQLRRRRDEGL